MKRMFKLLAIFVSVLFMAFALTPNTMIYYEDDKPEDNVTIDINNNVAALVSLIEEGRLKQQEETVVAPEPTPIETPVEETPASKVPPVAEETVVPKTDDTSNRPAEVAVATTPAPQKKVIRNALIFKGKTVYYRNAGIETGQHVIDTQPQLAATWGGAPTFSGSDGLNTHFIGHFNTSFTHVQYLVVGDEIVVTDELGQEFTYVVNDRYYVDRLNPTDYQYNRIVSQGGGERIIIQTCTDVTAETLIIVEAVLK